MVKKIIKNFFQCLKNITIISLAQTILQQILKNQIEKKKYLYFCGIGNPEEFEYTLKKYNFKIAKKFVYPDHHNFKNKEIDEIKRVAFSEKLKIITTEKDYKRLSIRNKKNIEHLKIKLNINNLCKFRKFLEERL